jgi:hypothetical protein
VCDSVTGAPARADKRVLELQSPAEAHLLLDSVSFNTTYLYLARVCSHQNLRIDG